MNEFHVINDHGHRLKARYSLPQGAAQKRSILLLGGMLADQLDERPDSRAFALERAATENGFAFIRFNYVAHGFTGRTRSDGAFGDVSITRLISNAVAVSKHFGCTEIALAGSSIGAGIAPFVARRIRSDLAVNVHGIFGVSALPPTALEAFVLGLMDVRQREEFGSGLSVTLRSPTLPVPVEVNVSQLDDLGHFRMDETNIPESFLPVRLLYGTQDRASTRETNLSLMKMLNGSLDDVIAVDAPHDIPHVDMLMHFDAWLERLTAF